MKHGEFEQKEAKVTKEIRIRLQASRLGIGVFAAMLYPELEIYT